MIRLLLAVAVFAMADSPEMTDFLRSVATDLAEAHNNRDPRAFLDHFDTSMPGYATLREEIDELVAFGDVGSAIEIATETEDGDRRTLELDWVLEIQDRQPRRGVVKCTVEKRGKAWKFTSLEPIEFFKY